MIVRLASVSQLLAQSKPSMLYGRLRRGEAYLRSTWLSREQRLAQVQSTLIRQEQAQWCSCRCFTADISRTFPVSGKFTAAQRDLYSAVLQVQVHFLTCMHAMQHFHLLPAI